MPMDGVIAAPERYSASNPACFASRPAMPLWAPGICRMPGPFQQPGEAVARRFFRNIGADHIGHIAHSLRAWRVAAEPPQAGVTRTSRIPRG